MSWVDRVKIWRFALSQRMLPAPVVFHHVPKCGGTSIGRALRLRYLLSQATVDTQATFQMAEVMHPDGSFADRWTRAMHFRESMLIYLMLRQVRCVSAHVAFSENAYRQFHDSYAFVTLLRDPVERFVSHYFHARRPDDYFSTNMSLEEFLDTPAAAHLGRRYVEYFAGPFHLPASDAASEIERAKNNLDKFTVVGFLDDLADFRQRMYETLGVRLRIGHENQRHVDQRDTHIHPAQMARIEALCAPDIAIYEHARTHFLRATGKAA